MSKIAILMALFLLSNSVVLADAYDNYPLWEGKKYYVGAGVSMNSINQFDDATGYQIMAGYRLDFNLGAAKLKTAVEVGFMNTGDFASGSNTVINNTNTGNTDTGNTGNTDTGNTNIPGDIGKGRGKGKNPTLLDVSNTSLTQSATGAWITGVAQYPLSTSFHILGRVGSDFGDDDGALYGGGFGYDYSRKLNLRAEYIIRNNVDSVQLNLISKF